MFLFYMRPMQREEETRPAFAEIPPMHEIRQAANVVQPGDTTISVIKRTVMEGAANLGISEIPEKTLRAITFNILRSGSVAKETADGKISKHNLSEVKAGDIIHIGKDDEEAHGLIRAQLEKKGILEKNPAKETAPLAQGQKGGIEKPPQETAEEKKAGNEKTAAAQETFSQYHERILRESENYPEYIKLFQAGIEKFKEAIAGMPTEEMYAQAKAALPPKEVLQEHVQAQVVPEAEEFASEVSIVKKGQSAAKVIKERIKEVAAKDGLAMSDAEAGKIAWKIWLNENIYASDEKKQRKLTGERNIVYAGDVIQIGDNKELQAQDDVIRKYLGYSDAIAQNSIVQNARNENEKGFFDYITNNVFQFSWGRAGEGKLYCCSTFTNFAYDATGLDKIHGSIANNASILQGRKLIQKSPNIVEESIIILDEQKNLDFIKKGARITVPSEAQGRAQEKISKIIFEADGQTYFEAGGKKYIAQMRYDKDMGYYAAIGKASEWNPLFNKTGKKMEYYRQLPDEIKILNQETLENGRKNPKFNPKKYEKEKKKYYEDKTLFDKVLEEKTNDPNLAIRSLQNAYPALLASEGKMDYFSIGYNANLAPNWRHAVFYKYIYHESEPMQIENNSLQVQNNSSIIKELNNFWANIPENAQVSQSIDKNGNLKVHIEWKEDNVRMRYDDSKEATDNPSAGRRYVSENKRVYQDNVNFSADLIIDQREGKAYYLEECRHKGGIDSDLQGAQFLEFGMKKSGSGFTLVQNSIFMFENTTSFDPTRVVQQSSESTIRAHYIPLEQVQNGFSLSNCSLAGKNDFFGKNYGEWGRFLKLIYGSGRYNEQYGVGQASASYASDTHLISANLIPKSNFDYSLPEKGAQKGAIAQAGVEKKEGTSSTPWISEQEKTHNPAGLFNTDYSNTELGE
ncbi:hypothetical protein COU37_00925 [Candidatus Micrarchaeota archaeon CG10_big_fil_rev_8_21_14_0_10_45_29]|nr:MAG: hypothetical protein COU37_00925 [Candidatus Micrarchaeota archaeon CG10_big_fil_rev_8_21_14_0_10_45_29]